MDQKMHDGAEGVNVTLGGVSGKLGWLPKIRPGGIVGSEIQSCMAEVSEDDIGVCGVGSGSEEDITGFDVSMADTPPIGIAAPGVETSVQELEG